MAQAIYRLGLAGEDGIPYYATGSLTTTNWQTSTQSFGVSLDGTLLFRWEALLHDTAQRLLGFHEDAINAEVLVKFTTPTHPATAKDLMFGVVARGEYVVGIGGGTSKYRNVVVTRLSALTPVLQTSTNLLTAVTSLSGARRADDVFTLSRFLRVRITDSLISYKTWFEEETEPAVFTTLTDTSKATGGGFGVGFFGESNVLIDYFSIGTDGDAAQSTETRTRVNGTVYRPPPPGSTAASTTPVNDDGYVVRLYHERTGSIVAVDNLFTTTGEFFLDSFLSADERVFAVAIDTPHDLWGNAIRGLIYPARP